VNLDLSVRDLGNWVLNLSIRDLRNRVLNLSISDLGHRLGSHRCGGCNYLSIRSLGNNCGGNWLSIGTLAYRRNDSSSCNLSISGLRGGGIGRITNGFNVNGRALRCPRSVVKVVEASAEALVPGGRATQGEGAVGAKGKTGSINGAGLVEG
jgi:hypothetical protein